MNFINRRMIMGLQEQLLAMSNSQNDISGVKISGSDCTGDFNISSLQVIGKLVINGAELNINESGQIYIGTSSPSGIIDITNDKANILISGSGFENGIIFKSIDVDNINPDENPTLR